MKYEVISAAAFMQQITNLIGHGYVWYRRFDCPREPLRRQRMATTLAEKYPVLSALKDQAYRRRREGLVNVKFLVFQQQAWLLMTEGEDDLGVSKTENFSRFKPGDIQLEISGEITVELTSNKGRLTWHFSKKCHARLKNRFLDSARRGNRREVQELINRIVSVIEPKGRLRNELKHMLRAAVTEAKAKRHQWRLGEFFIKLPKKSVRVFAESGEPQ